MEISPDGKSIVASRDWELHVLNAVDGSQRGSIRVGTTIHALSFSPDSLTLVGGGYDNAARFWDMKTLQSVGIPLVHEGTITAVSYNSDGSLVVTASTDGTARLWESSTCRPIAPAWSHGYLVDAAVFGPSDHTVITGSREGPLTLWEVPVPSVRDRKHLMLSIEVRSGYLRDNIRGRRPLSYEEWEHRRNVLFDRDGGFGDVRNWSSLSGASLVDVASESKPNWWDRLWVWIMGWQ